MDNERLNILQLLIESQEKTFSIRQISIQRKINYKSAHTNIKDLEKKGIVTLKKQGNTIICSFNRTFSTLVFDVEYVRLQELLKNKNFLILYTRLAEINEQFILLLFGLQIRSVNKRNKTPNNPMFSGVLLSTQRFSTSAFIYDFVSEEHCGRYISSAIGGEYRNNHHHSISSCA